jgi:hypothetical protein
LKLPDKLTRRAVKQFFEKIPEAKWEYWFRHEKENGLFELRVKGPFEKAYYNSEGVKEWLLTEGHYSPSDFIAAPDAGGWVGPVTRRHAMAA